jgi:hypothetical protein
MKKLFILFFILLIQNCYSQKKFFGKLLEYSTIYTSYSDTSPLFQPETFFVTQGGDVVNRTKPIFKRQLFVNSWIRIFVAIFQRTTTK